MRPPRLNPLFASASSLKGIGPKLDKVLAKLLRPGAQANAEARILDLLFHLPSGLIDRRERPRLDQLPEKGIVTVEVTVGKHRPRCQQHVAQCLRDGPSFEVDRRRQTSDRGHRAQFVCRFFRQTRSFGHKRLGCRRDSALKIANRK